MLPNTEPVIHRKKKIVVVNDRKKSVVESAPVPKPEKVKKVKAPKKVKQPPPPPRVRGPAPVLHEDGTHEQRVEKFLMILKQDHLVFQQSIPLKIKIHKDLIVKYPKIANHIICKSLHQHCSSVEYLRTLKVGAERFDLDLQSVDVVSEQNAVEAKKRCFEKMRQVIKPR
jgi:hypothetical protein